MPRKMPDLPDLDEDEARETPPDVNTPQGGVDEDGESDENDSPLLHSLSVRSHSNGHADIIAMIHGPTGFLSKRIVIPGGVTAKKLAGLLQSVTAW